MEEIERLRADVNALKVIIVALTWQIPESNRAVLREHVGQLLNVGADLALFSTASDAEIHRLKMVATTLTSQPGP